MSHSAARARAGRDRTRFYQDITDKIIAELEAGRVPWVQPWGTVAAKASLGMPTNATTQRRYSGVNELILWGAVIERGFTGQTWLTFRQALSLGGHVRKGEHGTTVVYADRFTPDEESQQGRPAQTPTLGHRGRGTRGFHDGLEVEREAPGRSSRRDHHGYRRSQDHAQRVA